MVEQATTEDMYHSDYFFWVDAGSWRWDVRWVARSKACVNNPILCFAHTSLHLRVNPLPNWPDSNKIRQLYDGDTTEGDEIVLASAILDKVMHFRLSTKRERKGLIVPPLPFALIGKAICAGWIFRRNKGTRLILRSRYACASYFIISTE